MLQGWSLSVQTIHCTILRAVQCRILYHIHIYKYNIYIYIYIYICNTHTHTESRASFPRAPRTEATDLHAEPFSPRRHNGLGMRFMFWIVLGFRDHGLEFAMEQRISENALCIVV